MITDNTNTVLESHGYPSSWSMDSKGKRWEEYDTILCPDGYVVDMNHLLDEQARAMAALTHLAPEFGGLVGKMRFVYTFRFQTQATDGYNLFVNPEFTDKLDFTGKVFVMAHEVMHCLLNHCRRGLEHDPNKGNIAADYEVNTTLADLGLFKVETMKKLKAYVDMKYSGIGYETIYDEIKDKPTGSQDNSAQAQQAQKNQQGGQQQQGGGGQSQQQPQHSADYKNGWQKAIEDWKAGKLQL